MSVARFYFMNAQVQKIINQKIMKALKQKSTLKRLKKARKNYILSTIAPDTVAPKIYPINIYLD